MLWGSVDLRAAEKLVRVCALLHRSQYRRVAFPSDEDNLEKPFSESIPSSLDWFRLSSRRSILSVSALIPREFRVVSISFEGFAIRQTLLVRSGKWWRGTMLWYLRVIPMKSTPHRIGESPWVYFVASFCLAVFLLGKYEKGRMVLKNEVGQIKWGGLSALLFFDIFSGVGRPEDFAVFLALCGTMVFFLISSKALRLVVGAAHPLGGILMGFLLSAYLFKAWSMGRVALFSALAATVSLLLFRVFPVDFRDWLDGMTQAADHVIMEVEGTTLIDPKGRGFGLLLLLGTLGVLIHAYLIRRREVPWLILVLFLF